VTIMSAAPAFTDEPYRGTQILWGRVVVLLLALALAFWLGTTFGGDASAQGRLEEQQAEIARLESQVEALEAEAAAVDAGDRNDQDPGDADNQGDDRAQDAGRSNEAQSPGPSQPLRDDEPDEAATADGNEETGTTRDNADGDMDEYVVQSGDSLAAIAQQVYGDPTLWREIARANDLDEPYSLTVGDTLAIPAKP
jgi:nucleoid-associated protein YgaU